MTKAKLAEWMDVTFREAQRLRSAGQAEYARNDDNAFANFERVSERLGISREVVAMTYLEKHLDGIHAWLQGHKSQREDVRGRILDAIVYLCILRGMIEESETSFIPTTETGYRIQNSTQNNDDDADGA